MFKTEAGQKMKMDLQRMRDKVELQKEIQQKKAIQRDQQAIHNMINQNIMKIMASIGEQDQESKNRHSLATTQLNNNLNVVANKRKQQKEAMM